MDLITKYCDWPIGIALIRFIVEFYIRDKLHDLSLVRSWVFAQYVSIYAPQPLEIFVTLFFRAQTPWFSAFMNLWVSTFFAASSPAMAKKGNASSSQAQFWFDALRFVAVRERDSRPHSALSRCASVIHAREEIIAWIYLNPLEVTPDLHITWQIFEGILLLIFQKILFPLVFDPILVQEILIGM